MKEIDKKTLKFIKNNNIQIIDIDSDIKSNKKLAYIFNNVQELREFFDNHNCPDANDETIALCIITYLKDKRLLVSKQDCEQVISFCQRRRKVLKLTK